MKTASEHVKKPAYAGMYNHYIKRVLDILISGAALLVLWPFFLIVSILIAAKDGFPVFTGRSGAAIWEKPSGFVNSALW